MTDKASTCRAMIARRGKKRLWRLPDSKITPARPAIAVVSLRRRGCGNHVRYASERRHYRHVPGMHEELNTHCACRGTPAQSDVRAFWHVLRTHGDARSSKRHRRAAFRGMLQLFGTSVAYLILHAHSQHGVITLSAGVHYSPPNHANASFTAQEYMVSGSYGAYRPHHGPSLNESISIINIIAVYCRGVNSLRGL